MQEHISVLIAIVKILAKGLFVTALTILVAVALVFEIAAFSQWRVEQNELKLEQVK